MPLLRNGRLSESDCWRRLADEDPLPPPNGTTERGESAPGDTAAGAAVADGVAAPFALGLARFLADADGCGAAGVWLRPDDDVLALAPYLSRLQLVAIDFPTFTDGRGYSQARLLRSPLAFGGEIRATGDVRPDQVLFMMRAGFDAFEFATAPDESLLRRALSRFRTSYQPSYALPIAG